MALILAIEPNRNQAQQMAQMVKQHVTRAELITEASAEAALAALGDRIPDLILTPALLAPRDEAALTDRLRQLGSAAAHIHMLAAPFIAPAKPRARDGSGLLGRRRDKAETADAVGCEPGVFAEQIKVYLDRAARERVAVDPPPEPADDFDELIWLPEEPRVAVEASASIAGSVPVPSVTQTTIDEPLPAAVVATAERLEKPRAKIESPATRAFEAEFGLPPSASTSPPLWRVTEEGIEALTAAEPVSVVHELPVVDERLVVAPPPAPATETRKAPLRPRRQAPPLDDWAYFDPQQSRFKALIRRLEQITADALRTPST